MSADTDAMLKWLREVGTLPGGERNPESPNWDRWAGPCAHGRDPWTRCDTCQEAGELLALAWAFRAFDAKVYPLEAEVSALRARVAELEELLTQTGVAVARGALGIRDWLAKHDAEVRAKAIESCIEALRALCAADDHSCRGHIARLEQMAADWRRSLSAKEGER